MTTNAPAQTFTADFGTDAQATEMFRTLGHRQLPVPARTIWSGTEYGDDGERMMAFYTKGPRDGLWHVRVYA